VENPVGTAPSFIVEIGDKAIISLPGVPHEMEHLLETRVLPYLVRKMGQSAVILSRWVHTVAIGESTVGEAISDLMHDRNPTVGTRAHPGQTDVCITAKAETREDAIGMLDAMEARVRARLGTVVYGVDAETLPSVVMEGLRSRNWSLAIGETTTDGWIATRLEHEGGGPALAGADWAADGAALAEALGIADGGGGEEAVSEMAAALREVHQADLGLAIVEETGEGAQLVIALATPDGVQTYQRPARGRSEYGKAWTLHLALDLVRRLLLRTDKG
jgi:nicotinamide-nucleotide amidase